MEATHNLRSLNVINPDAARIVKYCGKFNSGILHYSNSELQLGSECLDEANKLDLCALDHDNKRTMVTYACSDVML